MPSLSELTPAERARLLSKPEGELGIALGETMNKTNANVIEAVYRRLGVRSGQSVLEIGFGNGHTVPLLMRQAEALTYVGVDISEMMVAEAGIFNRELMEAGRAVFHLASAEAIPCADASFDCAMAINVAYFWPDPVRVLAEIRRVLRPDGFSILAAGDPATAAAWGRDEFGFRVRDADTLIRLHREAGFAAVTIEPYEEVATRSDGVPRHRLYHFVIAHP